MINFDKFTQRAKKVLSLAQEEAQRFQHNYIGTEHLLLGLVREGDGIAARVLANLGVELTKVRSAVEFIIGRGDRIVLGEISLTPRSKKVLELAFDEARRLNHQYIGTEHLLLGLIREGEGIGAGTLMSLGVNLETVRSQIIRMHSIRPGQIQTEAFQKDQREDVASAPPPVPPEALTLLAENEAGLSCSFCGALNLQYFRHCFNCGHLLEHQEDTEPES